MRKFNRFKTKEEREKIIESLNRQLVKAMAEEDKLKTLQSSMKIPPSKWLEIAKEIDSLVRRIQRQQYKIRVLERRLANGTLQPGPRPSKRSLEWDARFKAVAQAKQQAKFKRMTVSITTQAHEKLKELSSQTHTSMSQLICDIVEVLDSPSVLFDGFTTTRTGAKLVSVSYYASYLDCHVRLLLKTIKARAVGVPREQRHKCLIFCWSRILANLPEIVK